MKASPRSSSELFSHKIESERPIAVIRTDASHVTSTTQPQLVLSNMFVPISVSERFDHVDEELSTFCDYRSLQLLQVIDVKGFKKIFFQMKTRF